MSFKPYISTPRHVTARPSPERFNGYSSIPSYRPYPRVDSRGGPGPSVGHTDSCCPIITRTPPAADQHCTNDSIRAAPPESCRRMNVSPPLLARAHVTHVATHNTSDSTVKPLSIHRPSRR